MTPARDAGNGLERRVVGPGVAGVQDAQPEGRRPAARRSRARRPDRRVGGRERPTARRARPRSGTASADSTSQSSPRRRPAGRRATGRRTRGGDQDQPDPEGATAIHPQPRAIDRRPRSAVIAGRRAGATVRRRAAPTVRMPRRRTTLERVTDLTETAVARRVPSLADERLRVLSRRQPVTGPAGHLAGRVRARDPADAGPAIRSSCATRRGRLVGVLTERDIFGRHRRRERRPEPAGRDR